MIRVDSLASADEAEYRELLLSDPEHLVYASPEYRDFLCAAAGGEPRYLAARDARGLAGCLPCFTAHVEGIGTIINSLPWYGRHGGCVLAPRVAFEARTALLERYAELVRAPDVLSATMILAPGEDAHLDEYRARLRPVVEDLRIGQFTALPEDGAGLEDRLERAIPQKTRNLARKARKQGFELGVRDDDDAWRFLYEAHCENMLAMNGRAKPREHFAALRRRLPPAMRRVTLAFSGGEPVAALLLLYFNRTVEYFTPVIRHEHRPRQPLSFLIWHAMLDAAARGYRWWNWGGTWASQKSLHHFKAGWGAVDRPYRYLVCATAHGIASLREHRVRLAQVCPYYYLFPYDRLDRIDA